MVKTESGGTDGPGDGLGIGLGKGASVGAIGQMAGLFTEIGVRERHLIRESGADSRPAQ